MWQMLEQAAKQASVNASGYVSTVQEKAQSLVATVQDEAATLLHALGTSRVGPVDEILYEEIDAYMEFSAWFVVDEHTTDITQVLETNEEIRELHEQMVPIQLSYEEFWCRYFFREHQAEQQQKREEERQASGEDAADEEEELGMEHEDDTEEPSNTEEKGDTNMPSVDDETDADTDPDKLREARDAAKQTATKWHRTADQWKRKAKQLHHELYTAKKQLEEDTVKNKATVENLCDVYEGKMTQMTIQIDEARAKGYDEGIRESEAIIAAMRQEMEDTQESSGEASETLLSMSNRIRDLEAEIDQVKDVLKQAHESMRTLTKEKDQLVQENAQLKQSQRNSSTINSVDEQSAVEEAKKEIELWRMRAMKMKKLKEQLESELQTLKTEKPTGSDMELQQRIQELTEELKNSTEKLQIAERESFEKGVTKGKTEMEELLKIETAKSYEAGVVAATAANQKEILALKAELVALKGTNSSASVASDDALHGSSSAQLDTSADANPDLLTLSTTSEAGAHTGNTATQDDWGEW